MKKRGTIATILIVAAIIGGISTYTYYNKVNEIKVSAKQIEEVKPKVIDQNSIMKGGNIIYSAQKYAVPANEVQVMLDGKSTDKNKQIFLTFDDGPSHNTPQILKILKEEGVHATFFVLGSSLKGSEKSKQYLKDEIYEGNAIANHSFSHDFKKLYPHNRLDVNTFMSEINTTNSIMKNILGNDFDARVLRMPGGYMSRRYYKDPGLKELDATFKTDHITSIDWDAETGDATGRRYTPSQLLHNAIRETKGETHIILLMHDAATKKSTVEGLKALINYYKEQGYSFKVIENAPIDSFNKKIEPTKISN